MDTQLFLSEDIERMDKRFRAGFFNSVMGFKPAVLVGTKSAEGGENVAVFSSVFHMGSSPALFGMLFRPSGEVPRNTLENIEATGYYTFNTILASFAQQAHQTSAKYPEEVSEFTECGLSPEYKKGFPAPFVGESTIRLGMKWLETIPISHNNTSLLIGQVVLAQVPEQVIRPDGMVDIEQAGILTVSGLESYHTTTLLARFPYARP